MEGQTGYIRRRRGDRWTVQVRTNHGGRIWIGTFGSVEEAQWAFNAAEVLTERRIYDAEAFGHHVFRTHKDQGVSYEEFVKLESKRYSVFKQHEPEVNRFLNRLPGQPETVPQVVSDIAFTIIANELKAELVPLNIDERQFGAAEDLVSMEKWAFDAAEYLMGRRDYNAEYFENHLFRAHNDLGCAFRDFVVSESLRYASLRKLLLLVDSWLNTSPNQLDIPDRII
uniref:AP2/ERF domain-containing protein n=1 Tax=Physcomitrium patens TaxID=3218 RepID=A0A2K1KSX7_PHYPA|nr:hypothetical protein PHYPA_003879 [Physcomitrium patens]